MSNAPIQDKLGKLLKFGKKEEEEKKETYVRSLTKFDHKAIENYPRLEIKYNVYPSKFGVHQTVAQKENQDSNDFLMEGIVPVISEIPKLKNLVDQLLYHSKKSELLKYERIKNQSLLLSKKHKLNMGEEELSELLCLFPLEYDINISITPFKTDNNGFSKNIVIFTNDLSSVEELDRQLTNYRDKALNKILEEKISQTKKELNNLNSSRLS